ncbi:MAG: cache domain-containing protein [Deltaproteobacteria bacterium]|nr:cache domain-containing protein [Deltaproteobacteria bacterium]
MKRFLLVLLVVGLFAGIAYASEKDLAVSLVDKAAALAQAQGKEKALAEISTAKGQFDKGEIYVFAYDTQGVIVGHPKNPKLIGKNLLEVPDPDGKFFRKEIQETAKAKGTGWVDYKYTNPESKKVEQKTTYLKKVGDLIICCGIYK